jgi:hypothetical protein
MKPADIAVAAAPPAPGIHPDPNAATAAPFEWNFTISEIWSGKALSTVLSIAFTKFLAWPSKIRSTLITPPFLPDSSLENDGIDPVRLAGHDVGRHILRRGDGNFLSVVLSQPVACLR